MDFESTLLFFLFQSTRKIHILRIQIYKSIIKMPFTELVIPPLIQSDEARDASTNTVFPTLASILTSVPGFILSASGHIITENNVTVPESNFHPVLGIEWKDPKYFHEFVQSKEFQAFLPAIKPYLSGPPDPELYETDTSPRDILASPIIDVFRINIRDDPTKETAAKTAWEEWVKALGDANFLSGVSVNLPERLFIGMIGWSGVQERERSLEKTAHLKEVLEKSNDVQSLVVQLSTAP
ncbi:hypothetical protein OCU04_003313 [Sclerotinia nivalis]|uniref:Uncharacterized protein n=1 Tax=Sclerotinia nivalis TaxID=352851 RepID=A0A9X0AV26_9HELO|nr:hypothetical protein OCU04_003313 [Sclerotinia nivalis]